MKVRDPSVAHVLLLDREHLEGRVDQEDLVDLDQEDLVDLDQVDLVEPEDLVQEELGDLV